jgi:ceramide glucosyltransferase
MLSYFEMGAVLRAVEWVSLLPVAGGSVYAVLCLIAVALMRKRALKTLGNEASFTPAVTVLKPVHGLEKDLRKNLRSICIQDYPEFQVVFSVQEPSDPAIPLLYDIQREFGSERVTVAIEDFWAGSNGKINNMIVGLRRAKHDVLVISDSDVRLRPDYLKTIVAPLADPQVGCACTLYKGTCASRWFEKMELLTLNADFMTSVIFAHVSGASKFCLGASAALRRSTLDNIGGFEALADYLVEDYEMGRRIWVSGKKIAVIPYFVDSMVDLKTLSQWWNHQVYWDQNTRAARPVAFFATVLIRSIPFALLYAAMRLFDATSLIILATALAVRLATSAFILGWGFRDREGLRSLWLLAFRDIAALVSWFLAFVKRTTIWRGNEFILTRDGRLVAREAGS